MKKNQYWKITNKGDTAEIEIYGEIGESFWSDDTITLKTFKEEFDKIKDSKTINIRINSPGGSVFDGQGIYNLIKQHKASSKTVYIDGLAASAASLIAMAGNKIIMPKNSMLMIHKAMTGIYGNSDEMYRIIEVLEKIDNLAINIYSEKTGIDKKEIEKMVADETWLTGEEAFEIGFADEVEDEIDVAACAKDFDISKFHKTPDVLKNKSTVKEVIAQIQVTEEQMNQIKEDVAKKLKEEYTENEIAENLQKLEENLKEKKNKF